MEHRDYSILPESPEEYIVITRDGEGTQQIPAGRTTGIDELMRYQADGEPVSQGEVALGLGLSEMIDGDISAKLYADANSPSGTVPHQENDYDIEINLNGEKVKGEMATPTGLSLVSAAPGSSIVYPDDTPDQTSVSIPPTFEHEDLRTISLQDENSFEIERIDTEDFEYSQVEGLDQGYVTDIGEVPDVVFTRPLRIDLDVTDSDDKIVTSGGTRRSMRWVLDRLGREPFFLNDYQEGEDPKGPTYITEFFEEETGSELTPAVRTRKDSVTTDIRGSLGTEDVTAEFYLVNQDGEGFPAPDYVVVDKMLEGGEFLIDRTDDALETEEEIQEPGNLGRAFQ